MLLTIQVEVYNALFGPKDNTDIKEPFYDINGRYPGVNLDQFDKEAVLKPIGNGVLLCTGKLTVVYRLNRCFHRNLSRTYPIHTNMCLIKENAHVLRDTQNWMYKKFKGAKIITVGSGITACGTRMITLRLDNIELSFYYNSSYKGATTHSPPHKELFYNIPNQDIQVNKYPGNDGITIDDLNPLFD